MDRVTDFAVRRPEMGSASVAAVLLCSLANKGALLLLDFRSVMRTWGWESADWVTVLDFQRLITPVPTRRHPPPPDSTTTTPDSTTPNIWRGARRARYNDLSGARYFYPSWYSKNAMWTLAHIRRTLRQRNAWCSTDEEGDDSQLRLYDEARQGNASMVVRAREGARRRQCVRQVY